jgi:hypothetical protein
MNINLIMKFELLLILNKIEFVNLKSFKEIINEYWRVRSGNHMLLVHIVLD